MPSRAVYQTAVFVASIRRPADSAESPEDRDIPSRFRDFARNDGKKELGVALSFCAASYNAFMNDGIEEFDLIIAGGGIVGATLACLLDGLDLRIALVERRLPDEGGLPFQAEGLRFDPRVSAVNEASRRVLGGLGVWDEVAAVRCCDFREMRVWDAEGTGSIHFSADSLGAENLGSIVENSIVLARLYARLRGQGNLQLVAPFTTSGLEIGEGGATLTGDSSGRLRARVLVGADGGSSAIRELAGIASRERDYGQAALVTTVRTSQSHEHTAWQRFPDSGPLAFLPLTFSGDSEFRHNSIVWSTTADAAEELLALPDGGFRTRLAAAIEHCLGEVEWCDRRFRFPLRGRHAESYVRGNIVLVGDAAHTIHPLAGQGVNLGIQDAAVLAEELRAGLTAGRKINDPVPLGRYARRRKGDNLATMWTMEGLHRLFGPQPLPLRWLRNTGLKLVDRATPLKNRLARHAIGA